MDLWEYRGEVISAGSYNAALGGTSAGESLTILVKRLNAIGAEGWQLRSLERMSTFKCRARMGLQARSRRTTTACSCARSRDRLQPAKSHENS